MNKLMHTETGTVVDPGSVLHLASGPSTGQAWRFVRIVEHEDGHKIQCSRSHPKLGRVHREFHPHLFGCHIVIDVKFYADRVRILRAVRSMAVSGAGAFGAAVVAWLVAEYGNANLQNVLAMFGAH